MSDCYKCDAIFLVAWFKSLSYRMSVSVLYNRTIICTKLTGKVILYANIGIFVIGYIAYSVMVVICCVHYVKKKKRESW